MTRICCKSPNYQLAEATDQSWWDWEDELVVNWWRQLRRWCTGRSLRLSWWDRIRSLKRRSSEDTSGEPSEGRRAPVYLVERLSTCCLTPSLTGHVHPQSRRTGTKEDEVTRDSDWDRFTLRPQMLGSGWQPPHLEQQRWCPNLGNAGVNPPS